MIERFKHVVLYTSSLIVYEQEGRKKKRINDQIDRSFVQA